VGLSSLLLALVEVIGEYQIGAKLSFCSAIRARVWMDEFTPWPEAVNFMAINNRCAVPTIRPPLILQYFLDKIRHVLVRRFRSRIARRKASRILFEAATRPLLCFELLHGLFIELKSKSWFLVQSNPAIGQLRQIFVNCIRG